MFTRPILRKHIWIMGFKLNDIAVEKASRVEAKPSIWEKEILLFGKLFSDKKKEDFYTELGVLLKAGITLREALELIQEGQKKEKLREFYGTLAAKLVSGDSFSQTIAQHKDFTEYEYQSIRIGEESGTLAQIMEELGQFFSKKNEQRRNLINALTYPHYYLGNSRPCSTFYAAFGSSNVPGHL